ncbi:MAG TPA: T9SS type A sorting domain-containing protein, partial [Bacteroidia bacterium]|nr:T9SS type A sorting domain-containing protein [Bacteroidia bacterium]
VAVDGQNNIYVRAYSHSGPITLGDVTLFPGKDSTCYANSASQCMLVKYNPSGKEEWIINSVAINLFDMQVDDAGNMLLRGSYENCARFTNTHGNVYRFHSEKPGLSEATHFFIDTHGELTRTAPAFPSLVNAGVLNYVRDEAGNYYALLQAGKFDGSYQNASMEWQGKTYTTQLKEIFLAKFDKNQNPIWMTQFKGANNDVALDIVLDKKGNIILSGHYRRKISITDIAGDSIVLNSNFQTMFMTSFTPDGLVKWACNAGNLFNGFGEHLHLLVNSKNQLYFCGQINAPSKIGNETVDVLGEKGWQSPGWDKKYDYNRYSDGFFGSINLESPEYDVYVNLSLNHKVAAEKIKESLRFVVDAADSLAVAANFDHSTSFTPVPTKNSEGVNADIGAVVYPNPAGAGAPDVTAHIELTADASVTWTLIDQQGKTISTTKENYAAGMATYQFSIAGYSAGVYMLVIETGLSKVVKLLVVY